MVCTVSINYVSTRTFMHFHSDEGLQSVIENLVDFKVFNTFFNSNVKIFLSRSDSTPFIKECH